MGESPPMILGEISEVRPNVTPNVGLKTLQIALSMITNFLWETLTKWCIMLNKGIITFKKSYKHIHNSHISSDFYNLNDSTLIPNHVGI